MYRKTRVIVTREIDSNEIPLNYYYYFYIELNPYSRREKKKIMS